MVGTLADHFRRLSSRRAILPSCSSTRNNHFHTTTSTLSTESREPRSGKTRIRRTFKPETYAELGLPVHKVLFRVERSTSVISTQPTNLEAIREKFQPQAKPIKQEWTANSDDIGKSTCLGKAFGLDGPLRVDNALLEKLSEDDFGLITTKYTEKGKMKEVIENFDVPSLSLEVVLGCLKMLQPPATFLEQCRAAAQQSRQGSTSDVQNRQHHSFVGTESDGGVLNEIKEGTTGTGGMSLPSVEELSNYLGSITEPVYLPHEFPATRFATINPRPTVCSTSPHHAPEHVLTPFLTSTVEERVGTRQETPVWEIRARLHRIASAKFHAQGNTREAYQHALQSLSVTQHNMWEPLSSLETGRRPHQTPAPYRQPPTPYQQSPRQQEAQWKMNLKMVDRELRGDEVVAGLPSKSSRCLINALYVASSGSATGTDTLKIAGGDGDMTSDPVALLAASLALGGEAKRYLKLGKPPRSKANYPVKRHLPTRGDGRYHEGLFPSRYHFGSYEYSRPNGAPKQRPKGLPWSWTRII